MYLGEESEPIPVWGERTVQGPFGWLTQSYRAGTAHRTLHVYRCEVCDRTFKVIVKATEPFYCDCQRLVGVSLATN